MIKNIVFDLGGVIMTIDQSEAVRRFKALGLEDAEARLDPYTQSVARLAAGSLRLSSAAMAGADIAGKCRGVRLMC